MSDRPIAPFPATNTALATPVRVSYRDPAGSYLATLTTDKSRQTAMEGLRRIARALGIDENREDPMCWTTVPWAKLGAAETTMIRARLIESVGPATSKLTLSILRGVLTQAFRIGYMPAEQYQRAISWPPIRGASEPAGRMLGTDEIARIRSYCEGVLPDPYGAQSWAIIATALGAGLRREELTTLRVDSLSHDARHLTVMGKGRKLVSQPLSSFTGAALETWLALRESIVSGVQRFETVTMFVHIDRLGRVFDRATSVKYIWELVTSIARGAGLEKPVTPHDLRRTFASTLLDNVDLSTAQKLMRHEQSTTTVRYDRRGDKVAEQAVTTIDRLFGGNT